MDVSSVRKCILAKRQKLSNSELQLAAKKLSFNIAKLSIISDSKLIAAYIANKGEISPHLFLHKARKLRQTTFLPIVIKQQLKFAPVSDSTPMLKGRFNIPIPEYQESDLMEPETLEVVLVPLVAFDDKLNRIGMGGGFYDRSFSFRKTQPGRPVLIGIAHEIQKVKAIQAQSWDIPMDFIITEKNIYSD